VPVSSPPPPKSTSIAWILDAGTDFPPSLTSTISTWNTSALIRARPALTTRGWNGYSGNEHRSFRYLTEKKRLTAQDLTPSLLAAKSFHLICSAGRSVDQVTGILERRREHFGAENAPPLFIWEPVPDLCTPEELAHTYAALKFVDVVSPNHDELAAMVGFQHGEQVDLKAVEEHAELFLDHGIGREGEGAVVVRCGAVGCFILSRTTRRWLPACHTDSSKVIDPTGGGNAFLGGLAVGLVRTDFDVVEAARWGSVAASFAIEQTGMPQLDASEPERWNGESVQARLAEYQERTK
jgi:sugar/nucleoside kinase (ribokinase family)